MRISDWSSDVCSSDLHGSASLPQYDGYASDVIKPGQRKVYKYLNQQGGRTLWYHDHGVHRPAKNAYAGLAGQYHMHDEMERASGDRKNVGEGKGGSVRVDPGGGCCI